jgi:hypothetical protein
LAHACLSDVARLHFAFLPLTSPCPNRFFYKIASPCPNSNDGTSADFSSAGWRAVAHLACPLALVIVQCERALTAPQRELGAGRLRSRSGRVAHGRSCW